MLLLVPFPYLLCLLHHHLLDSVLIAQRAGYRIGRLLRARKNAFVLKCSLELLESHGLGCDEVDFRADWVLLRCLDIVRVHEYDWLSYRGFRFIAGDIRYLENALSLHESLHHLLNLPNHG